VRHASAVAAWTLGAIAGFLGCCALRTTTDLHLFTPETAAETAIEKLSPPTPPAPVVVDRFGVPSKEDRQALAMRRQFTPPKFHRQSFWGGAFAGMAAGAALGVLAGFAMRPKMGP
jgi:hypothetical protein